METIRKCIKTGKHFANFTGTFTGTAFRTVKRSIVGMVKTMITLALNLFQHSTAVQHSRQQDWTRLLRKQRRNEMMKAGMMT